MTTVSSTGSSSATASVVQSAANQILTSLGTGSGIDTATLVTQLVAANKDAKQTALTARQTANTAKISALATVKSGVDSFASALQTLTSGGTLATVPTTSDASVAAVSAISGGHVGDLSATLQVTRLAQAQTIEAAAVSDSGAAIGQGAMTLTTSTGSYPLTIDGGNDSLTGLAAAINGAHANVTASIVQDGTGYRLVVKGATGAGEGFSLAAADQGSGLAAYQYGGSAADTMTLAQGAQDAQLKLDGVTVTRSSNTVSDLVPGVSITLKDIGAVALGATRPTDAITQAMGDFVTAYNSLRTAIDATTAAATATTDAGALNGNATIRDIESMLSKLTSTTLSSYGTVSTLTEIGVSTNNDGTLTLDSAKLAATLASDPDGVEALFNPGQTSSNPLLAITSKMGAVKPGTYTLGNVTAQIGSGNGSTPPAGTIDGVAMLAAGSSLVAPYGAASYGLVVKPSGAVGSATITIDSGLYGAIFAIQSAIEASSGIVTTLQASFTTEAGNITTDQSALDTASNTYHDQLTTQFTAMQTAVTSYKSIQSYLTQQVALWTKSDG